jgi:hypothetical protein
VHGRFVEGFGPVRAASVLKALVNRAGLADAIGALGAALAGGPARRARDDGGVRQPREGTKH